MAAIPETSSRPTPPWQVRLERFWRWWSGELMSLAPALGATRSPLVAFEGSALVVLEPRLAGEDRVELGELDDARATGAVRALLEKVGESRGRARLALAPYESLVRRVTMPAATEENLANVLGFEMDRLTPFRAEDVYYDHRVVARDGGAGTLEVVLAVARREIVDAKLARLRELGVSVQGVLVREQSQRPGPALDLLPTGQRGDGEKPRERLAKQVLGGAALVLLLAALAIPAYRKRSEMYAITPAMEKAAAEAKSTDALIQDLERQVADYNFLIGKKHANAPALAYIEEIARLLPDNTWLQQLDIKSTGKAREVLISGETVSASKLIEILEQSQLLQNAAPRGPVTRGTQPGTERFLIAAEARPRTPPEMRSLSEVQSVAPPPPQIAPSQAAPAAPPPPTATVTPVPSQAPPPAAPQQDMIFKPRGYTPGPDGRPITTPSGQPPAPPPPAPSKGAPK
jgi:general secretion pathway protein L